MEGKFIYFIKFDMANHASRLQATFKIQNMVKNS